MVSRRFTCMCDPNAQQRSADRFKKLSVWIKICAINSLFISADPGGSLQGSDTT